MPSFAGATSRTDDKIIARRERLINAGTHTRTKVHTKGIFADHVDHGAAPKDPKVKQNTRRGNQTFHRETTWKKGRLAALGGGVLALGAGYAALKRKKETKDYVPPPSKVTMGAYEGMSRVGKSARAQDMGDYKGKVTFRDRRYDEIEARRLMIPSGSRVTELAGEALAGEPVSAVTGVGAQGVGGLTQQGKRGMVVAQSREGAGPDGIGRHVGWRKRSYIKPGYARAGEEDLPFKVARRSKKDRDRERVKMTAQPAALGAAGVATGAALGNKTVRSRAKLVRDAWKNAPQHEKDDALKKIPKFVQEAGKKAGSVGMTAARHPGKIAAGSAVAGALGAIHGYRRKPDTHEIKFVHPKAKDKAKK